jgi:hypothetical protein
LIAAIAAFFAGARCAFATARASAPAIASVGFGPVP